MAITVNTADKNTYRTDTGQTDGNEVIYKLDAKATYIVNCIVTSAGTATLKVGTTPVQPSDFTNMAAALDGTQSVNFAREVKGCRYVGLDIASSSGGTWTVEVSRV